MRLSELGLPAETLAKVEHLVGGAGVMDMPLPEPTGWFVLVLQYTRTEAKVLPGGAKIYFAESTKKEDVYQGRVGLVLAVGPEAYADKAKYPRGAWVRPGEWVTWPALSSAPARMQFGGLLLAFLPDDALVGVNVDPVLAVENA
jgi:hypothetical protein